mgnify:FL=1
MRSQAIVPLVTYPDPNSETVAANAAAMAAWLQADLHALALNVDIPPVSNALSQVLMDVPQLARQAESASQKQGDRLLAAVAQQGVKADVDVTVSTLAIAPALLSDAAASHGRYFDFVLVGWERNNPTCRTTAEAVVFGSGRPTVLLPEQSVIAAVNHVAIAWDGSRVAARAVGDSRRLLEYAKKISVITIVDEKPLIADNAGERLVERLRNSGLEADARAVRAEGRAIGATLQEQAIELGADLLVMGGYGHSRVRDFVLGGATRGILSDLRLPVLISH